MPTLENINGASLVASPTAFSGGFGVGMKAGEMMRDREAEAERQARLRAIAPEALKGGQDALGELLTLDPETAKAVATIMSTRNKDAANKLSTLTERVGAFSASIVGADPGLQRQMLMVEAQKFADEGNQAQADEALAMAEMAGTDPDRLNKELMNDIAISKNAGTLMELFKLGEGDDKAETQVVDKVLYEKQSGGEWKAVTPTGAGAGTQIPQSLLAGLDPPVASKVSAAYTAAGGGKDGMEAANKMRVIAKEDVKREQLPQTLTSLFPNASPAERSEIDAATAGSVSADAAIKKASSVRTEQRRLKKAKVYQQRAVDLLTRIIEHPELNDVVGGIEGGDMFFRMDQGESDVIADIEEAQSILTSGNMDLMTGVLSESDILLLKQLSSGGLNRKRNEKTFIKDATEMRDRLSSKAVETADDRAGNQDVQAVEWARNNPNDPRAAEILRRNGIQ